MRISLSFVFVIACLAVLSPVSAAGEGASPISQLGENGTCLDCHSNAGHLMQIIRPPQASTEDSCASAPERPAFLGAFVNPKFPQSLHGEIGCTGCHGGDATADDAAQAHTAMTSADAGCSGCHKDIAALHATSLHNTLAGMAHALEQRSGPDNFATLHPMWQSDCASCHASCSDCHVTIPDAVGGGLIKGHEIFKRPPMEETCVVCHATRAGGEYMGHFEGVSADVHFQAGMHCLDCHKNDLHGDGVGYTSRWDVAGKPACTDCHPALPNDGAREHDDRHANVSCQVCHAQPYQNCSSCHSTVQDGTYMRHAGKKVLDLKIGRNTVEGYPYDIVPLRRNPADRDSFEYFGRDLLRNHDQYPTWKTAVPHNIVREPEQSRTCRACHKNEALFLKEEDLLDTGTAANRGVIHKRNSN